MKIRNLTSQRQFLTAEELVGGRSFSICVEGNGVVDLEGLYPPALDKKIFKIEDAPSATPTASILEVLEETDSPEDSETDDLTNKDEGLSDSDTDTEDDELPEESAPATVEDKFICSICNAEFASGKGLSMHMKKAHPEE